MPPLSVEPSYGRTEGTRTIQPPAVIADVIAAKGLTQVLTRGRRKQEVSGVRESRQSYGRPLGAVALGALVCVLFGACSGQVSKQTAQISPNGWGAGDKIGSQLFDSKQRAARGQAPIAKTIATAQAQTDQ